MTPISFKRHRFPPIIIQHAVWLYARFTLSFRDVEDLLAERGIEVSNETVRRWFLKFGRVIARNLRHSRPRPSASWHLDEMVIKSAIENTGYGGRSTTRARCSTSWSSDDAALDRRGDCFESCSRSRASRRPVSPRTSSNRTPSPSAKSGFARSTIRGCRRIIGLKIHISPFDDESENSSGSSPLDPPNASCRSTPLSTTPSTSNAISFLAASSRRFGPRRL
jgi:hypothetical protein